MELERKIVVLFGAGNNLGRAIANSLTDEGARLIVIDFNKIVLDKITAATGAITYALNSMDKCHLQEIINKTICRFGKIDLFISITDPIINKGHYGLGEAASKQWHQTLLAQLYFTRHVLPHMIQRGRGHFIFSVSEKELCSEYFSPFGYTTLHHPVLGLAERLNTKFKNSGISTSILRVPASNVVGLRSSEFSKILIQVVQAKPFMISYDVTIGKRKPAFSEIAESANTNKINRAA